MKILVIEDNAEIQELLSDFLVNKGYEVKNAYSGTEGLLLVELESFDLIILDLMLPGKPGSQVLEDLKKSKHKKIPVIVVSAKNSMTEKISLLRSGADDYLDKPFNLEELLARIELCINRTKSNGSSKEKIIIEDLEYDIENSQLQISNQEVVLTAREFNIFCLLLKNPRKIFTKQEIYELAWDTYYEGEDKTINVHIGNIRKKLASVSDKEWIETIWGMGFRINPKRL